LPVPNLIHPVPVVLERKVEGSTLFDPVAREPVRQVWRLGGGPGLGEPFEVEAQADFNRGNVRKPEYYPGGVEEKWAGYLLFRVVDLLAWNLAEENPDGTLTIFVSRGDRIARIGRRSTSLYVAWFRDVAGYPDQGGLTLLEVQFTDRLGGKGA